MTGPETMLSAQQTDRVIRLTLEEDVPVGDLSTQAFMPAATQAEAALMAREPGVASGMKVFGQTMRALDERVIVETYVADGISFETGQRLATVSGPAQPVLTCERTALNLVQRMSGIATLTAAYARAVEGTRARIVDTRKTTPGLRALDRYAVRCGGGHNHRFGLSDAVMAKDNHLALVEDIVAAVQAARRSLPHTTHIEMEVDRLDQIPLVLEGGAASILLDNFSLRDLRRGVELIGGRAVVEASGGVTLETVAEIAGTGVDVISVGALTHSVRSLDLGLDTQVRR